MRRLVLPFILSALLAMSVSAQEAQAGKTGPGAQKQVTVNGKRITGDDVLVRKGITFVSVPALTRALGGSVASQGQVAVISVPAAPESECEAAPETQKLSDAYRKAAVRIPDAIESIRALVQKKAPVIPAARFDELEHEISEADFRIQTDADKSVSYALSHASNTLAIAYYRSLRGIPTEQADQLDSVLCSMESKFALQVGRLSGRETCSVFRLHENEAEAKPPLGR